MSSQIKHMLIYQLLFGNHNKKIRQLNIYFFIFFRVYDSNQIILFFNKRFLLFKQSLRSFITKINIAYMILIISL